MPDATPDVVAVHDTGSKPDVLVDPGLKVETYAATLATAMCGALERCCFDNGDLEQDAAVDGGSFDRRECLDLYRLLGFESSNVGLSITQGNVEVHQPQGADCLAQISALACNLDGPSLKTIRAACFNALKGKLKAGDACKTSLECSDGNFCLPTTPDGGPAGTCTPLRTVGQNCSVVDTGDPEKDSVASEIACSQRGGATRAFDVTRTTSRRSKTTRPRADGKCQPTVTAGQGCNSTVWCADSICGPGENLDKYVCGR